MEGSATLEGLSSETLAIIWSTDSSTATSSTASSVDSSGSTTSSTTSAGPSAINISAVAGSPSAVRSSSGLPRIIPAANGSSYLS